MHTHAGSTLHNPMTLTFWPQGQCMPRSCQVWWRQHKSFLF